MGTLATITLYADSPEEAQRAFVNAFRRIAELDSVFSDYRSYSELSRVCNAAASPEMLTVLRYAQQLAAETDGAFDITIGPLTRLWRLARKGKRLPEAHELAEALARTGYRKLQLQPLRCLVPGMQLDAGGIAKGYAADEALKALRSAGVGSALIAISGDIVAGDAPPGRNGWRVRAQHQDMLLDNAAVSTSGDEFQFIEIGGVRYSHIIDPRTGMPLTNAPAISVVAKTGMEADALATAICVIGLERAKELHAFGRIRIFSAVE